MFSICLSIICFVFLLRCFLHRTGFIYVVKKWVEWVNDRVHLHQHFNVPELNGSNRQENEFYRRVSLYVNSLASLHDSDYVELVSGKNPNDVVLCPGDGRIIHDNFLGGRLSWTNKIERDEGDEEIVYRSFELRIKKKDRRRILKRYIEHIVRVSDEIERRGKQLRIYRNGGGRWRCVPFDHPARLETIAMDADLKSRIKSDLETFVRSEQYYRKIGRVWRRSYLLYGPSGAGKSSFVAAVANLLDYDVYSVDLSKVMDDADLEAIASRCASRSVIVVEDLDRWFGSGSRSAGVTFSGLMSFMDGLSSFRGGRIMIFTASGKEFIDSDLLRPGRIDVHIHFPNCDFDSFKSLAGSYLGVKEHKLFPRVEEAFRGGSAVSAAEIGELMLVNRSSPKRALKSVISALRSSGRRGGKVVPVVDGSPVAAEDGGDWKEALPKEIRKLYGLLRMKSRKKSAPLDRDCEIIER